MSEIADTPTLACGDPAIAGLLSVADAFAAARDISLSRVSTLCFNDGAKITALVNGADIGARRLTRALAWFSENWPDGAPWPADVERPFRDSDSDLPQVGSFQ